MVGAGSSSACTAASGEKNQANTVPYGAIVTIHGTAIARACGSDEH